MHEKIENLLSRKVYVGTSSWKYLGWKGLVYNRHYPSEKAFNETCLTEYAEHFTAVGVDHTYYTWPTETAMTKYAAQTPAHFRFGFKATERTTIFRYPNMKRYGKEAGKVNESFLNPDVFKDQFLLPLQTIREKVGPIMFEFSHFYPGTIASGSEFVERLDRFFTQLKLQGEYQFAVEIRNGNWLQKPYFDMLAKHQVGHVFNSWTKMPSVKEQLEATENVKLPWLTARLLLQPGTKYEEAVEAFSPYDRVQELQPVLREAGAQLVHRALKSGVPAYVFVNNRAEGSAPLTITGILDLIEDL